MTDDYQTSRRLYARAFDAGWVELGPNRDPGVEETFSLYSVFILPLSTWAGDWLHYR